MKNTLRGKRSPMKKTLRIIGVVAVIAILIGAIVASMNVKPSNAEKVWDKEMTIGNLDAKNYFIIYSDLVCPYCLAFENAIVENEEAFQEYIKENDILVEVRLSDYLYEFGESNPKHSRYSAVATYCAKSEGKFWDYYNNAVSTVWRDFFKESGKTGFTNLNKQDQDYWTKIGEKVGLGDEFKSCIKNQTPLQEIKQNAEKSVKLAEGMPFFKFNKFTSSGFNLAGDWQDVLMFFQAGLDS